MCPECGSPLIVYELEGVEVDHCLSCEGTWLDAGEVERLVELAGASRERLKEALYAAKGKKHGRRRCPRCRRKLQVIHVEEGGTSVEVDRCPGGDGLWLDRGELQTMVACFIEGVKGAVACFFGELYKHRLETKLKGE